MNVIITEKGKNTIKDFIKTYEDLYEKAKLDENVDLNDIFAVPQEKEICEDIVLMHDIVVNTGSYKATWAVVDYHNDGEYNITLHLNSDEFEFIE